MEIDTDKIDEVVLAPLCLTLHDGVRAWKGHDWDALDRLHRKGMIYDPVGKTKSVVLTDAGLAESEAVVQKIVREAQAVGSAEGSAAAVIRQLQPVAAGSSTAGARRGG